MTLRLEIYRRGRRAFMTWAAAAVMFAPTLGGVTLEELRADPDLSPKRLMSRVANFKYQLHAEVQSPEVFLSSESGDCDDFATLAALVLREKGFTPRLIAIRMPGLTHVVCYIPEVGSYLDYNNRVYLRSLVKSKPEIREIAEKVARSFDSGWTTASEFLYTNQVKIMLTTVARAEEFASTPPPAKIAPSAPAARTNKPTVRQLDISF